MFEDMGRSLQKTEKQKIERDSQSFVNGARTLNDQYHLHVKLHYEFTPATDAIVQKVFCEPNDPPQQQIFQQAYMGWFRAGKPDGITRLTKGKQLFFKY